MACACDFRFLPLAVLRGLPFDSAALRSGRTNVQANVFNAPPNCNAPSSGRTNRSSSQRLQCAAELKSPCAQSAGSQRWCRRVARLTPPQAAARIPFVHITCAINDVPLEQAFGLDLRSHGETPLEQAFGLDLRSDGALAICGFTWRGDRMATMELDPAGAVWHTEPLTP